MARPLVQRSDTWIPPCRDATRPARLRCWTARVVAVALLSLLRAADAGAAAEQWVATTAAEQTALHLAADDELVEEADADAPEGGVAAAALLRSKLFDGTDTCAGCHVTLAEARLHDVVGEVARSVHSTVHVGCAACHGGDAHDPTARAHDPQTGFHARPRKTEIASICGGCHSSELLWKQLGLTMRADQPKAFAASRHGIVLATGDERAPSCTTCHGTHAIARVKDAAAPVQSSRVAGLCGQCHSGRAAVGNAGAFGDPVAEWSRSVHARALAAGNREAPSCTGCHGAHSTVCPPHTDGASACARCHEKELEAFENSPHERPFARLGTDACVGCHDRHDVPVATSALAGVGPESACVRCHAWADKPVAAATALGDALERARAVVARTQATLASAEARGVAQDELRALLAELRVAEKRVRLEAHRVAAEPVAARVADLVRVSAQIEERLRALPGRASVGRRGAWGVAAVVTLLAATLAVRRARGSRRRRGGR